MLSIAVFASYGRGAYGKHSFSGAYCGDGNCDAGESCSSCPADCGYCAGGGSNSMSKNYLQTAFLPRAEPGKQAVFSFRGSSEIKKIELIPKKTIISPRITLKYYILNSESTKISPLAEGPIYKYFKVSTNFDDNDIKSAQIEFALNKNWLKNNQINPKEITLKRFASRWTDLNTLLLKSDPNKYYYVAESPGFSLFAIGTSLISFKKTEQISAEDNSIENNNNTITPNKESFQKPTTKNINAHQTALKKHKNKKTSKNNRQALLLAGIFSILVLFVIIYKTMLSKK